MALTRAQLLMGNASQGTVLANQVQGVKQGSGVIIAADGTISFDPTTATGLVRLNNSLGYNGYVWPNAVGGAAQVLQGDGLGNLSWVTPATGPVYTAKGEINIGTGAGTSSILTVGADGTVLTADSTSATGLKWAPAASTPGLGIDITGGVVKVSIPTASTPPAVGAGTTQAVVGSLYWDDTLNQLFIYYSNGGTPVWVQAAPSATSGGGGSGTVTSVSGTLPITVATGTTTPVIAINAATTAATGSIQLATAVENAAGTDATKAVTPAFSVPKDAAGMTGAAILPGGTNAQRPATPTAGMLRWNTDTSSTIGNRVEVYNTTYPAWQPLAYAVVPTVYSDYTVTNGEVLPVYIICKNFIVPAGVIGIVGGSVYVEATGNVTIDGTLTGGGTGARGAQAYGLNVYPNTTVYTGSGFGFGPGSTTSGGVSYSARVSLAGSGGSGAFVSNSTAAIVSGSTGSGGGSGGSVLIRCEGTATISATGFIDVPGLTGDISDRTQPSAVSGPGGGSGGVVIIHASGNVTNSGTIEVSGGAGVAAHNNASGGGGGGGGIVILQSDFGTETTGTVNLAGGVGGPQGGAGGIGGGGGGGCGGAGGQGGSAPAYNGNAGSAGVLLTSGSPF